jgi:hypothetical protein
MVWFPQVHPPNNPELRHVPNNHEGYVWIFVCLPALLFVALVGFVPLLVKSDDGDRFAELPTGLFFFAAAIAGIAYGAHLIPKNKAATERLKHRAARAIPMWAWIENVSDFTVLLRFAPNQNYRAAANTLSSPIATVEHSPMAHLVHGNAIGVLYDPATHTIFKFSMIVTPNGDQFSLNGSHGCNGSNA